MAIVTTVPTTTLAILTADNVLERVLSDYCAWEAALQGLTIVDKEDSPSAQLCVLDVETTELPLNVEPCSVLALARHPDEINDFAHILQKPFSLNAFSDAVARLRAEQINPPDAQIVLPGGYRLNRHGRTLEGDLSLTPIALTEKEAAILTCLHEEKEAVSRADLLERLWGYDEDIDTHTLETHIYRLRQKLEKLPGQRLEIISEKDGYRLDPMQPSVR